jgi:hypothetical protein
MKGYIYKIASPNTDLYYIGSTMNVNKRFSVHLSIYKKYNDDAGKINSMSYIILKCGDPYIEILDELEYENKDDLVELEKKYIIEGGDNVVNRNFKNVNKYYNKDKKHEYYMKHQQERIQYQRDYRKKLKLKYTTNPKISN